MAFQALWNGINRIYSKHLLLANIATASSLLGLGDIIIQKIEVLDMKDKPSHNWKRTGRMFCMGLVLGPFNHCWYTILDKFLPQATGKVVFKKILCDQLIAAPFFCSSFFFGMGLMEGKPVSEAVQEVRSKFLTVYMVDWMVWPPAQFINFYFLPTRLRVAYVSLITLGWNTFLSWMKHREHVQQLREEKDRIKAT